MRDSRREILLDAVSIRPTLCSKCGAASMKFQGVGEYKCEKCGHIDFDDYGKVRNYIENHNGATAGEIEEKTGVSQKVIRELLKENRIEVAPESRTFIKCEICGVDIRYGRYCSSCEAKKKGMMDTEGLKKDAKSGMKGFGPGIQGEEGAKRFIRK